MKRQLAQFCRFAPYVHKHSPYYAYIMKEHGIEPHTCTPEHFPVMTKHGFYAIDSSGKSGQPAFFVYSKADWARGMAHNGRLKNMRLNGSIWRSTEWQEDEMAYYMIEEGWGEEKKNAARHELAQALRHLKTLTRMRAIRQHWQRTARIEHCTEKYKIPIDNP